MRLTISPEDKCVIKDGDALIGLTLPASPNIHIIQWYDTWGVIERVAGSSVHFTDPLVVKPYLDAWQARRDEIDNPPSPPAPTPTTEQIVAGFVSVMEKHYDSVAKAKNYDNRFTCALRAGYTGPFQPEGQAFAIWMDDCNALAYSVLEEVKAGIRPQPTIQEFIAMLPVAPW